VRHKVVANSEWPDGLPKSEEQLHAKI